MKIVVAAMGKEVAGHFGHCENFIFFDTEENKIVSEESVPNAKVIISGGMGGGAVDIFNERGVEVIVGASGDAREAAEAYLKGELVSTGSICHEHQHGDECGE